MGDGHEYHCWILSGKATSITPHPLGGLNMGSTPDDGVVTPCGEVFRYRSLYVVDGAIVPTLRELIRHAVGALAEHPRQS